MTIAFVQSKNTNASATTTLSAGTGAGNTVFYAVYAYGSVGGSITASAPKVGGSAYAPAVQVLTGLSPGTNNVMFSLWMFPNLPSGATAFSTTVTGGTIDSNDGSDAWEYSGLGPSPFVDVQAPGGSGTSGAISSGTTPATLYAPELVFGIAIGFGFALTPPGAPWTGSLQPSSFCSGSYQIATSSGGTYTYSPAGSGNDWVAGAVTIAPSQPAPVLAVPPPPAPPGRLSPMAFQFLPPPPPLPAPALAPAAGAAVLSGSGTLTASELVAFTSGAALTGSGSLTAAATLPGALARDASSPATASTDDPGTQVATQVSNAFSPPAGAVIIVTAAAIESGNGNWSATPFAITDSLGSHLSWNLKADQYDNTAGAFDERFAVFWAYCPAGETGMTVSVTVGVTTGQYIFGMACNVDVWTGANTSGPIGALVNGTAASTSTLSQAITPTALGSALFMYGGPTFDPTANPTAGSGCYGIHPGNAAMYYMGEWAGTSGGPALTSSLSPQTLAMTFTGPQTWEYVGYEVLAAPGAAPAGGAVLTGSGALTAAEAVSFTSAAVLSGSGTVTAGELVAFALAAALSGSGTLTAPRSVQFTSATVLSGTGTLTAQPLLSFPTAAALSGSGTISAAAVVTQPAAASLSGTGSLTTVALVQFAAAAALSGSGALAAAAVVTQPAASALSGSGTLAAAAAVQFTSACALSGSGNMTASAVVQFAAAAVFAGSGTLAASALVTQPASAALSGSGSLAAAVSVQFSSAAVFAGSGSLTAAAVVTQPAASVLTGSGSLTVVASVQFSSTAVLSGTGNLTAAGAVSGLAEGSAALSGSGTLTAAASLALKQAAALAGSGTMTAAALVTVPGGVSLSGTGLLLVTASVTLPASAALSGLGVITAAVVVSSGSGVALSGSGSLLARAVLAFTPAASLAGSGVITVSVQVISPVTEPPVLWSVQPAALRWRAAPRPPRWSASPSATRWRLVMAQFPPIAAVSLEEVNVTWESGLAGTSVDPTGQTAEEPEIPVYFAFPLTSGNYNSPAQPATWFAASWLLGGTSTGFLSQCLVGPGGGVVTLTAGQAYDTWVKLEGSPEAPVKFAGVQAVF